MEGVEIWGGGGMEGCRALMEVVVGLRWWLLEVAEVIGGCGGLGPLQVRGTPYQTPPKPPLTPAPEGGTCLALTLLSASVQFFPKPRDCSPVQRKPPKPPPLLNPGLEGILIMFLPPPPSRAPSLRPATVSLTPSASFNGICNRQ